MYVYIYIYFYIFIFTFTDLLNSSLQSSSGDIKSNCYLKICEFPKKTPFKSSSFFCKLAVQQPCNYSPQVTSLFAYFSKYQYENQGFLTKLLNPKLQFLNLRDVFRTQPNIYDGGYLLICKNRLTSFSR